MQNWPRFLRMLLFYTVHFIFSFVFIFSGLFFIWFFPFRWKFSYLANWNRISIWMVKYLAGVSYHVSGLENIPEHGPYVVLAKHQSQWETVFLLLLFYPVSIILKKELLAIPGFGWGLRMLKPIPIDRSNPKQAIKQIQSEGLIRLKEDKIPILIFPEGTRMPFGKVGKYARGGAALAVAAEVPLLFITHNAGYFWPNHSFMKRPGIIDVVISKPVDAHGKTSLELTQEAQEWIEANLPSPRST